jgi:tetratricopeptide (TPR) repeat protein
VPLDLSAIYAMATDLLPEQFRMTKFYIAGITALLFMLALSYRVSRKVTFGGMFFILTLLPVIRFKTVSTSWAADRYMYLPSVGLFLIIAVCIYGFLNISIMRSRFARGVVAALLACVFILLSVLTWERCTIWKDTRSLFTDVIIKDPNIALPYSAVAKFYRERGDLYNAIIYAEAAHLSEPGRESYNNLLKGIRKEITLKERTGQDLGKIQERSISDHAKEAKVLNVIGEKHGNAGELERAIEIFKRAVKLDPENADAYNNLGYTFFIMGDRAKGKEYFARALELNPDHEKALKNMSIAKGVRSE